MKRDIKLIIQCHKGGWYQQQGCGVNCSVPTWGWRRGQMLSDNLKCSGSWWWTIHTGNTVFLVKLESLETNLDFDVVTQPFCWDILENVSLTFGWSSTKVNHLEILSQVIFPQNLVKICPCVLLSYCTAQGNKRLLIQSMEHKHNYKGQEH